MNKRMILGAAIAAVVVGVAGFWYWRSTPEAAPANREATVERGPLKVTILASGTVKPENRLEIKPAVGGRIEQVLINEGDKLRRGQIIAWMSSTERAALLDSARSQGAEELKKWEEIYRPTPVLAPLDGTLISRRVESGQTVATTDSIFVMSDRLTVKAQVDETDLAQIKLKQRAEIILDAYPNDRLPAQVDQIAFEASTVNNVTTYIIDVLPDQTPPFMRSGMTANVTFMVSARENVLLMPTEAVKIQNGKAVALKKIADRKEPQEVEVELGASDGKRTEVVSGLSEGDVVVITGARSKGPKAGNPFSPMGNSNRGQGRGGSGGGRPASP